MDTLRRILAVMVFILVVLVGAGIYYSQTMKHGNMNMTQNQTTEQPKTGQAKQNVTVVLQPDLKNYINEINKGISLINEANGLITSDPFFSDPPKVPQGKLDTTPYDKLIPKDTDKPILVLPDGTYQIIQNNGNGLDMRDIHRGIYKLGQGMTVLNTVLDRMNDDIRNNNFPVLNTYGGATTGSTHNMSNMPGMTTNNGPMSMPGMNMSNGTMNMSGSSMLSAMGTGTVSNVLRLFIVGFLVLAIISVIGFIFSLFKPKPNTGPSPE